MTIPSMSMTRRIRFQLQVKTTEELLKLREKLLEVQHDQTDFYELVEQELRTRDAIQNPTGNG